MGAAFTDRVGRHYHACLVALLDVKMLRALGFPLQLELMVLSCDSCPTDIKNSGLDFITKVHSPEHPGLCMASCAAMLMSHQAHLLRLWVRLGREAG